MNGTQASDAPVVLHDYWRSSAAYRVRIALNLKGISYTSVPVSLVDGEQRCAPYRALNPQGFVPMLEIDGQRLTQSLAIVDYLDATRPDPPMVPKDALARSRVLAMALTIACDIHPLNNLRVLRYLKEPLGHDEPEREEWYRHWLREGLGPLEAMARDHAATYLSGDTPGIADLALVPQLYNARRLDLSLNDYPTLVRVDAALAELKPFAAAHPDRIKPGG